MNSIAKLFNFFGFFYVKKNQAQSDAAKTNAPCMQIIAARIAITVFICVFSCLIPRM